MEIKVKNLGVLKQAEFTLGDLTLLCGGNNTGKTYATYALFGFLYTWQRMISIPVADANIQQLLADGATQIEISDYMSEFQSHISQGCQTYSQQLSRIFAAPSDRFQETTFEVFLDPRSLSLSYPFQRSMRAANAEIFSMSKPRDSSELTITLLVKKEKLRIPTEVIQHIIADALKEIIFAPLLPTPFIASTERTGAAIFRKELNFARNRLLEEMSQAGKTIDPVELLLKEYENYALPIEINVDFTRQLESLMNKKSFLLEEHPNVLADFSDIIGGEYAVTRQDGLYFIPQKTKRVKLSMGESSSAVRSLLDIGFYLRHEVKRGDLLMVDEPELNLHPENQRRIARLFARLINLGIKVFITTHSDYIVKELNTLIMLKQNKDYIKKIAEEEGYRPEELLSPTQVKVYIAEEASILLEGKTRKTKCPTLTPAKIDPELGIEARSFDTTIETMNRIQEAIVWGRRIMSDSDIAIIRQLIQPTAQVPLKVYGQKHKVILQEANAYEVTIHGIPLETEAVVIKTDTFSAPKSIFVNSKGECKRADFVIIAETNPDQGFIICIEMKSGKGKNPEIAQQLKGAQCFVEYCQAIGKAFWNKESFLKDFEYRFVSIKNISVNKKPTHSQKSNQTHDRPERPLKLTSPKGLQFHRLISGEA